ncbi:MAG: lactate racemase domain-containing protein, partial [Planctomycetota bacterium]
MDFELDYGDGRIPVDPPGTWETLAAPKAVPLPDPTGALVHALANPAGAPPLEACVSGGGRVVISVPDLTRPFPTGAYLPPLLDALNRAGVSDAKITALVATGIHRPLNLEEIERLLGPAAGRVEGVNHDPAGDLASLGVTARSTPVEVNGRLPGADLILTLGSTAFHFHAGFGGG